MKVIVKNEAKIYQNLYFDKLDEGHIFVYPTDTIYGIGCDATNKEAVAKIREAKDRAENPFSVIAPSKQWILDNCEISEGALNSLPGQVTLIVRLKNKDAIADNVSPGLDTVGVRIPKHWISDFVQGYEKPVVTTSVNKQGEQFITQIEDISSDIKGKIDFAINEGEIKGRPSTIINTIENNTIER